MREPKIVLLVDDDEDLLVLMRLSLELDPSTPPVRVKCARNGVEALALALAEPPHLIVTDLEMPVCSGQELVGHLRRHAELRHVPILLVSGTSRLEAIGTALDVHGWLSKPWERGALCRAVLAFLQRDGPALTAAA